MKVALVHLTPAGTLGERPWLIAAIGDRALVGGVGGTNGFAPIDGTNFVATAEPGVAATDGQRIAFVGPKSLTVYASLEDKKPQRFAVACPLEDGKKMEILSLALVPGESVIWAVFSDTFAVAQGRYIARLAWKGSAAKWGPLKSPYDWSPYSHSGMFLESVGAATNDTTFLAAHSEASAVVARVGTSADKGTPIERGIVVWGTTPASLLVFKRRSFQFYNAAGTELASFGFSGGIKAAIGNPSYLTRIVLAGRNLWLASYTGAIAQFRLSDDPPAMIMPGVEKAAAAPPPKKVTGPYGEVDISRSRSPEVIAIERVRAWDLNETPNFGKPAPFAALVVQSKVVQFCRERDGKLRKSFDFMSFAVTVTTSPAPKAAKAPKGVVLASLRTPSGLTQVLCRKEFAETLAANTGPKDKRPTIKR